MELFEKRGKWCFRDENNKIHKFLTKKDAEKALNIETPEHHPEEEELEEDE